ncbi:MAG: HEAT repeat domain-containing protein [Planctomycetota bacterium]
MCRVLATLLLPALFPALFMVPLAPVFAQEEEPAPTPVEDPLAERVREIVLRLGSDDFAVRKKAYRELDLIAPRAMAILETYRDHPDPDVARLVRQVIEANRRQARTALLGALATQDTSFPDSEEMAAILARGRTILPALHAILDEEDAHYPRYSYWRLRNTWAAIGALAVDGDLDRLLARLAHPNIQHRLLLQPILVTLDEKLVLAEFRRRLADPKENDGLRAQILEICRSSGDWRRLAWLTGRAKKLLDDEGPAVRSAAVRWFAFQRDEALLGKILEMAGDEDATVRTEVVRALRYYRDPAAEKVLRAVLSDPEPTVRAAAIETLRSVSGPGLAPVVRPYLKDPDPMVRSQAARALGQMGDRAALPVLIELLAQRDEEFLLRGLHAVVDALGRLKDAAALAPLFALLDDAGKYARIETYRYHILSNILMIGGADVLDRVGKHLEDGTMQNAHVVLDAIARIDDDRVIPFLMEALEHGDKNQRNSAVRGLASRGHRAAAPLLVKAMAEEEDAWFLAEALRALTSFGVSPGKEAVLRFLAVDPADVRNINLVYGAIRAATRFHIPEAAPRIAALLDGHADRYSFRAVDALGRLGDDSVVPALERLLPNEKYDTRKHRIALAMARLGHGDALTQRLREMPADTPPNLAGRAEALAALGRDREALAAIDQALRGGSVDGNTLYNLGCVLSLMGMKDRALQLVDRSMAQRVVYRRQLTDDADLDPIREDPRFAKILAKAR